MTSRERVRAAMDFGKVDIAPLQYYYASIGYYEHGEKLNDLFEGLPGDFEPFSRQPIPRPGPECYDADGSYHSFVTDEWGTLRERRIFGVWGIPCEYPLDDMSRLNRYRPPEKPALSGPAFDQAFQKAQEHKKQYYKLHPTGSLLERMCALRRDADVLCDIALNEPDIHRVADMILDQSAAEVALAIKIGADGIAFGDDYGTERGLIMSPEMWRGFFKPRLAALFRPAVEAGLHVVFHSCGKLMELLPDLRAVGVTAIWPQLPAYNMIELAARCKDLGLAVAVHTDRANTMTYGKPEDVKDLVKREYETFRMGDGGSWFYVEADNGFPFENLEALVDQIAEYRPLGARRDTISPVRGG
jgi:uroporphyrinogen decarboxylase